MRRLKNIKVEREVGLGWKLTGMLTIDEKLLKELEGKDEIEIECLFPDKARVQFKEESLRDMGIRL